MLTFFVVFCVVVWFLVLGLIGYCGDGVKLCSV